MTATIKSSLAIQSALYLANSLNELINDYRILAALNPGDEQVVDRLKQHEAVMNDLVEDIADAAAKVVEYLNDCDAVTEDDIRVLHPMTEMLNRINTTCNGR